MANSEDLNRATRVTAAAVFRPVGETFVPAGDAVGPWSADARHGGPPAGLLAYAIEREVGDQELRVVRFTLDLFRAVPHAPLSVAVERVRSGRRVVGLQASLLADGIEVSRASALDLRRSESRAIAPAGKLPGRDGLPSLADTIASRASQRRFFVHMVDAVMLPSGEPGVAAAWFRLPVPLIEGEVTTAFQRVATLSDFGNLLAGAAEATLPQEGPRQSFINVDLTVSLGREPAGEWMGLRAERLISAEGRGTVQVAQFDEAGQFGHSLLTRLANPR